MNNDQSPKTNNGAPVTNSLAKTNGKIDDERGISRLEELYPHNTWEGLVVTEARNDPNFGKIGLNHKSITEIDPIKLITLLSHRLAAEELGIGWFEPHFEDGEWKSMDWTACARSQPFDGSEETDEYGDALIDPKDLTDPLEKQWAEYTVAFELAANTILYELKAAYGNDIFKPELPD